MSRGLPKRIPEPELMDDPEQALAYAGADFAEVNRGFVERFRARFPAFAGRILDLGTGPADIPRRLVADFRAARVTAVDGSAAMLRCARERLGGALSAIDLVRAHLPPLPLQDESFDAVISNSLLHHLPAAEPFWREIRRVGRPGAAVLVMDLSRPATVEDATAIVDAYAAGEPAILRRDFFHSLCAAFTPGEVRGQLLAAGLEKLEASPASDRHWLVSGLLP